MTRRRLLREPRRPDGGGIDHLRHAIGMWDFAAQMATQDSDFDPIRDQPAFRDLVGR
jgi:hypothetical protein